MYTLLYTYAIPAHSLVLTDSQALVPAGPAKLCLVRCLLLLVHIQAHLYSHLVISIVVIFYIYIYTIGMCHMLHAYLCYVWLS